jgi:hypothetical protein
LSGCANRAERLESVDEGFSSLIAAAIFSVALNEGVTAQDITAGEKVFTNPCNVTASEEAGIETAIAYIERFGIDGKKL